MTDFKLSPHFTFLEMTDCIKELQEENRKEAFAYLDRLKKLCFQLEIIRAHFGVVRVDSAFRFPVVNKQVGGTDNSQHLRGEAADIYLPQFDLEDVFRWIWKHSPMRFGQVVYEKKGRSTWIHYSLGQPFRANDRCGQVLRGIDGKYETLAIGINVV